MANELSARDVSKSVQRATFSADTPRHACSSRVGVTLSRSPFHSPLPIPDAQVVARAQFQPLTMRMRAKKETYNNITRPKVHVIAPKKMDFVMEGKQMLQEIAMYDLPAPATAA